MGGALFDFSNTHWSQIRLLGGSPPPSPSETQAREQAWQDAWDHLARKYEPSLVLVARRCLRQAASRGVSPDQAEDVVQEFLATCLAKDWLLGATPQFGRFRSFVLTLMRRFTLNWIRRAAAQKRRPEGSVVSFGDLLRELEPTTEPSWDDETATEWVRCVLNASNARVRARSPRNAQAMDILIRHSGVSNADLALMLGEASAPAALARHRGIQMLKQEVAREIAQTVSTTNDYAAEIALLAPYVDDQLAARPSARDPARPT